MRSRTGWLLILMVSCATAHQKDNVVLSEGVILPNSCAPSVAWLRRARTHRGAE